jgi:hypothetical protein
MHQDEDEPIGKAFKCRASTVNILGTYLPRYLLAAYYPVKLSTVNMYRVLPLLDSRSGDCRGYSVPLPQFTMVGIALAFQKPDTCNGVSATTSLSIQSKATS